MGDYDARMEFARRLGLWLRENGRSGAWLAREMGVDCSTVNMWANGTRWPQFSTLRELCLVTGESAEWWLCL